LSHALLAIESLLACLGVLSWLVFSLFLAAFESYLSCFRVFSWLPFSIFLPAFESYLGFRLRRKDKKKRRV
jgi:hypothetical protein